MIDSLDQDHTYYLNGQVVVGRHAEPIEDLELYRPATLTGKVLRLDYAKAEKLAMHLDLVAAEGEGYVEYWLRPGDEAVEMAVSEPAEREVVPEGLRGYS